MFNLLVRLTVTNKMVFLASQPALKVGLTSLHIVLESTTEQRIGNNLMGFSKSVLS